ncbi:uncharacterized protein LOC118431758 [Branchiostoma floridae]|uniref:Uncharacterized protein LOC118431758 n=1 Tax=Branchiostoma floridae TaxID=7739 RepID=A0A9J7MF92_BRAFL|nr:uncharacterized protein LOC118431758 [Branchiostoma floridae]
MTNTDPSIQNKRKWPGWGLSIMVKLAVLMIVLSDLSQLADAQQDDEKSPLALMESNKEGTALSAGEKQAEGRYFKGAPVDHTLPVRLRRGADRVRCRWVCKRHCCRRSGWWRRHCYCCEWEFKCGID